MISTCEKCGKIKSVRPCSHCGDRSCSQCGLMVTAPCQWVDEENVLRFGSKNIGYACIAGGRCHFIIKYGEAALREALEKGGTPTKRI